MEQQAELLKMVLEINKTVTALAKKVKHLQEEALYNAMAVVEQLKTIRLTTTDTQPHIMALEGKGRAPNPQATEVPPNKDPTTNHTTSPLYKSKGKPHTNLGTTKPNANPLSAHHPCRAVICFLPDGNKEEGCMEPALVISTINNVLVKSDSLKVKHIKVVAASYNNQGNLIVSTQAEQRAMDLLQYMETFLPLISQGYKTSALEDKHWFKIQINGVSTHTMSNYRPRTLLMAEMVHDKLMACNPTYTQAANHIFSLPCWMCTQELRNTLRSSLIFAVLFTPPPLQSPIFGYL